MWALLRRSRRPGADADKAEAMSSLLGVAAVVTGMISGTGNTDSGFFIELLGEPSRAPLLDMTADGLAPIRTACTIGDMHVRSWRSS